MIRWSADECSFEIPNIKRFEVVVLPKYFNHSNFKSFIRQVSGRPSEHRTVDLWSASFKGAIRFLFFEEYLSIKLGLVIR